MTTVQATLAGETRWTAMLSSDMVGFAQLSQSLGNENTFDLLQEVLGIAHRIIDEHGGTVVDTAGDGILAAFGAPRALENASAQCCKAAFAFHAALDAQADAFATRYDMKPQFRTGIAGGSTMIARAQKGALKAVGAAVNLSARLCALAGPGEIVINETVRSEAEGDIESVTLGPVEIKGYAEKIPLHVLTNVPERSSRFESAIRRGIVAFMSREREIAAACSGLVPEDSNNAPKIVLISGVPGVGKSRLTHEILEQLAPVHPAYIGQCASRGTAPALGPIHDILKQAGVQPTLTYTDKDDIQNDPFAEAHTARTVARDQLRSLHSTTKAIIVIEDAHWIDAATSDLIATLTSNPIPMIVTCRTMFDEPWVRADSILRIDLNPLQPGDIQRIVEAHVAQPVSPGLANLIWTKSEGIPLVAEEIARALTQNTDLINGQNGLELPKGNDLHVTGNLEQMVMARVDALPPAERIALQVASAIGREFSQSVLSQVLGQPCDASLIQKMGGLIVAAGPNLWRFSHALVQDAVYSSQLTAQRLTIHLKIAQTLEANPNLNGSNCNLLAEHYVKAEIPGKAVQYLLESAHENLALYALAQVDQSLELVMDFIESDPDAVDHETLGDAALVWLRALDQSGAFAKVLVASDRILPLLDARPYLPHRSIAKTLTAIAMAHSRDYKAGEDLAKSTLTEAMAEGDDWGAAWAKVALMRIYEETHWSSPEETEKLADQIAPVALATNDKHLGMTAQYLRSSLYRSTGRRLKALDIASELSDFAQTHHDRRAQSYALWAQALVYGIEGNPEAALETIAPGRKDAVQGAADTIIFDMIALYSQVFLLPYDDIKSKLDRFHAQVEKLGDFNMIHAITWITSLSQFMAGRLAEGWQTLHKLINDEKAAANVNMLRQALMSRAEIQLVLNGLIDPAAEAPASRPTLPRKKPGFADFARFAGVRVKGLRQASADYHALIETDRLKHGNIYARAQIGLGLIALRRGQKGIAAKHLGDGLAAAQEEKLGQLVARAQTALRNLA